MKPTVAFDARGRAHAKHLAVYPSHTLLPEITRTLCAECDGWVWRDASALTLFGRRVRRWWRRRHQ